MKINPQHTVPTLDDNGQIIWDSHVICTYLVTKYGKDDALYPKDPYQRAVVDQRLHFESGMIFPRFIAMARPVFFGTATDFQKDAVDNLLEAFTLLETFLGDNQYLAGNKMTLADLSCVTVTSTAALILDLDQSQFSKIFAWIKRLEQLPYYNEINAQPAEKCAQLIKGKLEANRAGAK